MVKQNEEAMHSSKRARGRAQILCSVAVVTYFPKTFNVESQDGGGYILSGSVCDSIVTTAIDWPEMPHLAFANLRSDDPKSVELFFRRYGLLDEGRFRPLDEPLGPIIPRGEFRVYSREISRNQESLRKTWHGDVYDAEYDNVEDKLSDDLDAKVEVEANGEVLITFEWLRELIWFLFWRDFAAGKIAVCENPNCPAPYFPRKRRTQKICEQGSCVVYAQRKYSLDWWNRKGKQRRDQKTNRESGRKGEYETRSTETDAR